MVDTCRAPCAIVGSVLQVQLQNGQAELPLSQVSRSRALTDALETQYDEPDIALVAPAGYLERWFEAVLSGAPFEQLSTPAALDLLQAADFLQDEQMVDALYEVMARRLFTSSTADSDSEVAQSQQVLDSVPKHLVQGVLQAAHVTLEEQISHLPEQWHEDVIHAAFPSVLADRSLELNCSEHSDAALAMILFAFSKQPLLQVPDNAPTDRPTGAKHIGLTCARICGVGDAQGHSQQPMAYFLSRAFHRTQPSSVSLSVTRCDDEGLEWLADPSTANPRLESLSIDIDPRAGSNDVASRLMQIQATQHMLQHAPQLKKLRLVSPFPVLGHSLLLASNASIWHSIRTLSHITSLTVDWGYADPDLAHSLLSRLTTLRELSFTVMVAEPLEGEWAPADIPPPPAVTQGLSRLTKLTVNEVIRHRNVSSMLPVSDADAHALFVSAWFHTVISPILAAATDLQYLHLHKVVPDTATSTFRSLLAPLTALSYVSAVVESPDRSMVPILDTLTPMHLLTDLAIVIEDEYSEPPDLAQDLYVRMCQLPHLEALVLGDVKAGVPQGARQVPGPFGLVDVPPLSRLSRLTRLVVGGGSKMDGGLTTDIGAALPHLQHLGMCVYSSDFDNSNKRNFPVLLHGLGRLATLRKLDLFDDTKLGVSMTLLAPAVTLLTNLTSLILVYENLPELGLGMVFRGLRAVTGLRSLKLEQSPFKTNKPPLTEDCAAAFAAAAECLQALQCLTLQVGLTPAALEYVAAGFAFLAALTDLHLADLEHAQEDRVITSATMHTLAAALPRLTSLRELSLGVDLQCLEDAEALGVAIALCPALSRVGLQVLNLTDAVGGWLGRAVIAVADRLQDVVLQGSGLQLTTAGAEEVLRWCPSEPSQRCASVRVLCEAFVRLAACLQEAGVDDLAP